MQRKIFNRLSFKVFIISFLLQLLTGALICIVLYMNTPAHSARGEIADLVIKLGDCSKEEAGVLIDEFIERTGIDIAVYDDSGSMGKFDLFDDEQLVKSFGNRTLKSTDEVREAYGSNLDKFGFGNSGFNLKDSSKYYVLTYFDHGTMLNTMNSSIVESLPLMTVVVIVLSLINSFVYAFLFARPVKQLSKYSRAMAELDFGAKCPENRRDEIGDLARDLNLMSETLDQKIKQLKEEINLVRELELQKETFFAAASHELKTPVTILEGNIRGMIEGVEPYNDRDEYLSKSLRTVKRIESLINEILTASKMQSASGIVLERIDMCGLMEEKISELNDLFDIRNISVEKNLEKGMTVEGNKELTSLALGAFLSNAVFYSSEGSGISIRVYKDADKVVSEIRNSNAHIDEKDLAHLFEPFYRSDASRNRNSGGSGLGLYIAKLIVEKQNGECVISNSGEDVLARIRFNSIYNPYCFHLQSLYVLYDQGIKQKGVYAYETENNSCYDFCSAYVLPVHCSGVSRRTIRTYKSHDTNGT